MVTVGMSNNPPMTISTKMNFQMKRTHFSHGMRATPKVAMSTPEVGVIMLVKPSPNWNAITVV